MKKILSLSILFSLILLVTGCETKEEDHAGIRGQGGVALISDLNPATFIAGDGNSYVQFVVALPEGESVEKAEVVVSLGDNRERAKVNDITTYPATITVTLADVAAAIDKNVSEIPKGSTVYIEVVTTKDGVTTRSNPGALAVGVVCTFNPDLTKGSYHSVSPADQWASEGDLTITADPLNDHTVYVSGIEALEGSNEDGGPMPMHINPATFKVTADKTVLVSSVTWGTSTYHNLFYFGTGTYNSCTGKYTMSFTIGCDEGTFGTYPFTLTKNSSK